MCGGRNWRSNPMVSMTSPTTAEKRSRRIVPYSSSSEPQCITFYYLSLARHGADGTRHEDHRAAPQACILLPLLVRLPVGSGRIFHQLNELRYEERAAAFPTEYVTTLTTYPCVSTGFRAGRPTYPRAQIGFLRGCTGLPGSLEAPT